MYKMQITEMFQCIDPYTTDWWNSYSDIFPLTWAIQKHLVIVLCK